MTDMKQFMGEDGSPKTNLFIEIYYQRLAVHLFLTICNQWGLSEDQAYSLTGLDDWDTFLNWKKRVVEPMMAETYMRLTTVIEVNKLARSLHPNKDKAIAWLQSVSSDFGGHSPIDYILMRGVRGMHNVNKHLYFKAHIEPEMTTIN